jgi:hypothetical protein
MAETLTRAGVMRRDWPAIVLEAFVAAMAVYGGVGLLWNNAIGMPAEWLAGTPFTSWLIPGALLLMVVALPMATAAVLEVRRSEWAAVASVVAGAAQIGWIGAQLVIMQRYNFLQPVMLGFGLAVLLLAVWACRHRPLAPK